MIHAGAFSHPHHKLRDHILCQTTLIFKHRGFWSDCSWTVYYCPTCDQYPVCVDGSAHWWNYHMSEESRLRLFPEGPR